MENNMEFPQKNRTTICLQVPYNKGTAVKSIRYLYQNRQIDQWNYILIELGENLINEK